MVAPTNPLLLASQGISELGFGRANIGIKRVGELDFNAFSIACRKGLSEEDIDATCAHLLLCSKWEEEIRNPNWHPFQVEMVDGKEMVQPLITNHLLSCFLVVYNFESFVSWKICSFASVCVLHCCI